MGFLNGLSDFLFTAHDYLFPWHTKNIFFFKVMVTRIMG